MRALASLLLSLSAGAGTWTLGAILWSTLDPTGAGAELLFTIPISLATAAVLAIAGMTLKTFHHPSAKPKTVIPSATRDLGVERLRTPRSRAAMEMTASAGESDLLVIH